VANCGGYGSNGRPKYLPSQEEIYGEIDKDTGERKSWGVTSWLRQHREHRTPEDEAAPVEYAATPNESLKLGQRQRTHKSGSASS